MGWGNRVFLILWSMISNVFILFGDQNTADWSGQHPFEPDIFRKMWRSHQKSGSRPEKHAGKYFYAGEFFFVSKEEYKEHQAKKFSHSASQLWERDTFSFFWNTPISEIHQNLHKNFRRSLEIVKDHVYTKKRQDGNHAFFAARDCNFAQDTTRQRSIGWEARSLTRSTVFRREWDMYLVYDVRGIQKYIFAVPKLKGVIGDADRESARGAE